MQKPIPGTVGLYISLDGKISKEPKHSKFTIMGGRSFCYSGLLAGTLISLTMLAKLAWFEVGVLPTKELLRGVLRSAKFVRVGKHIKSLRGEIMVFKHPVVYQLDDYPKELRIVPGYVRYAVSEDGDVYDTLKAEFVIPSIHNNDQYLEADCYEPLKGSSRRIRLHRLVALAWIPNNDWAVRYIVNHKDSDRQNLHKDNLEWVTYQENNIHAVMSERVEEAVPCKVKDHDSGEVIDYPSISMVARALGVHYAEISKCLRRITTALYHCRYEIKRRDDETPWYYDTNDRNEPRWRHEITVTEPDGTVKTFRIPRDFKHEYCVWNVSGIRGMLTKFEQMYPNHKYSYIDRFVEQPVQAYNLRTGEVLEGENCADLGRMIGWKRATIRSRLQVDSHRRQPTDYLFRYKSDEPWDMKPKMLDSEQVGIHAKHVETGEEIRFASLRQCARHFDVDRCQVQLRLKNGKPLREWQLNRT